MSTTIAPKEVTRSASSVSPCFRMEVIVFMELIVKGNMSTTIAPKEVTRSAWYVSPCFPMKGHRFHGADSQGKYEYNYCPEGSHKIGIIC